MSKYDDILNKMICFLKQIDMLIQFDNLSEENAKKTRNLGKKIDKYISQIVNNEEGIAKYKLWLISDDIVLRWNAAINLFPLYPQKCLDIMSQCEKKTKNMLTKSSMRDVINNYEEGINANNIFIRKLKNLYCEDDLSKLIRE